MQMGTIHENSFSASSGTRRSSKKNDSIFLSYSWRTHNTKSIVSMCPGGPSFASISTAAEDQSYFHTTVNSPLKSFYSVLADGIDSGLNRQSRIPAIPGQPSVNLLCSGPSKDGPSSPQEKGGNCPPQWCDGHCSCKNPIFNSSVFFITGFASTRPSIALPFEANYFFRHHRRRKL